MLGGLAALGAASLLYLSPSGPGRPDAISPPDSSLERQILETAQFSGPTTGWLLLRDPNFALAQVVVTRDAGLTWSRSPLPPKAASDLFGIQLLPHGFATAQMGRGLFTSRDSGATWRAVRLPGGNRLGLGAYFIDPVHGWYVTLRGTDGTERPSSMWATADGGATWKLLWAVDFATPERGGVPLEGDKFLVGFTDPSHGWLDVRSRTWSLLLATRDGGKTWAPAGAPVRATAVSVASFGPRLELLLSGPSGYIVAGSDDQGLTWGRPVAVPVAGALKAPAPPVLIDARVWLVPEGTRIERTRDGGKTWARFDVRLPSGIQLTQILSMNGSGRGYGLGRDRLDNPYLLRTGDWGRTWSEIKVPQLG